VRVAHPETAKREAGKRATEQFVADVWRAQKPLDVVGSLLWWPSTPAPSGSPDEEILPLRIYKGTSWGLIEFSSTDVDGSVDAPDMLKKYTGEVELIIAGL
jgi:hypothetical protein